MQRFNNSNDRLINNQKKIGGLAQLVERVLSMHEVVSSILTFSKLFILPSTGVPSVSIDLVAGHKSFNIHIVFTGHTMSKSSGAAGSAGAQAAYPMSQYLSALPSPTSAGGGAAAASSVRAIVHQALANPKVLAGFAELRSHPAATASLDKSGTGDDPALRTLDLFAKGTHKDYAGAPPGTYLSLTDGQLAKLRQLTVVSVAQGIASEAAVASAVGGKTKKKKGRGKTKKGAAGGNATTVPYDLLRTELGLDADGNIRDLEDILISCLYSGLISGRLDQHSMSLWIEPNPDHPGQPPVAARDVTKADVPRLIAELERFLKRSRNVLAALDGAAQHSREGREADARAVLEEEMKVVAAREQAEKKMRNAIPGIDDEQGWAMAAAAASIGGAGGQAAMDLSGMEGGGRSGSIARRQTKRSRAAGGGEGFLGGSGSGRF